ncbi:MAG: cobalt transporter CbiM [Deltaproteobacteria bacterium]|nr:cobalt transporter CbiM [Deltaproteobacteria bacterium]MBW2070210.1 cobalt transporter CbiM [Deltaproteobacteria bacterium]
MHISEGVLSAPVLLAGVVFTAAGVAVGLKKTEPEKIPQVAVLTSAFFVASLVHVPIGFSSVHLVLNGLLGLLLGWAAFPAILVALALQALLFQFGGLTTLGINTFNMAFPALVCYYLFARAIPRKRDDLGLVLAFMCGFIAILLSALLVAACLVFTGESFMAAAKVLLLAHLPVMCIEGTITAFCYAFIKKVKPEMLGVTHAAS